MNRNILTLKSLYIGYSAGKRKRNVLPSLNATAAQGELIALIGRNGIGKSTLLRTLTGIQPPLAGEIIIDDRNISDYKKVELARRAGYVSTENIRVSNMTVYDLVALGRFPHTNWLGKIENEDNQIITNSLEETSMASFSARFINEISDGERQKAMIARLLAQDTSIMILDEPTAFLDVSGRYEIIHLLHKLAKESLKTIIFSTHDLQMAVSQADKVWLLLGDRLVEGAPEDLMLSGAFGELFDSSSVHFDRNNGTFSFMGDTAGSIYVEGEGDARRWTDKALNRAGFTISSEITGDYIVTPKTSGQEWKLISGSEIRQFHSIYELIRELTVPGI